MPHTLTLNRQDIGNMSTLGVFFSHCSCGWYSDTYSTLPGPGFYNEDNDECETAAVEAGSDHVAYSA